MNAHGLAEPEYGQDCNSLKWMFLGQKRKKVKNLAMKCAARWVWQILNRKSNSILIFEFNVKIPSKKYEDFQQLIYSEEYTQKEVTFFEKRKNGKRLPWKTEAKTG